MILLKSSVANQGKMQLLCGFINLKGSFGSDKEVMLKIFYAVLPVADSF
ncbi:MAG: hypothetical protein ACI85I_000962 [Arenicella sp.]